ncbi:MAG: hypothetical protein FWG66_06525 [Spirochaetes bacterium]|nr:hypothetical protein [Spirochaetota bacterium]
MHLVMAWSERSIAQANVIVFAAHDIFGGVMDRWSSGGIHFASGDGWTLTLNSQRIDDGHYYWPAGTVLLWISAGN